MAKDNNSTGDENEDNLHPLLSTLSKTSDLTLSTVDGVRNGMERLNQFSNLLNDQFSSGFGFGFLDGVIKRPNEMIGSTVPNIDAWDKCKEINGLSVWDRDGLWHCLFPSSIIPYSYNGTISENGSSADKTELLSKDDIVIDNEHWFQDVHQLLQWKSQMHKNLKQRRREQWDAWKKSEGEKWTSAFGFTGKGKGKKDKDKDKDKDLISKSVESNFKTLENGQFERVTIEKKTFTDGTTKKWEKKELLNADGSILEIKERRL
ncbi:hypothetical protein DAMA08_027480 [Martiniozyma asiatica (nom. inval.)]|nr:hypothetical protein DAMA08_027480 [Martiniozyma asiatica]